MDEYTKPYNSTNEFLNSLTFDNPLGNAVRFITPNAPTSASDTGGFNFFDLIGDRKNKEAPVNTAQTSPSMFTQNEGVVNEDINSLYSGKNYNIAFPEFQQADMSGVIDKLNASGLDIDTLTKRLLTESGTISSNQSEVDKYLGSAIGYQEAARKANVEAITKSFDTLEESTRFKAMAEYGDVIASSSGGRTSMYAEAYMQKQITDSIRDLESRKQSAIAEGNAKAYEQISNLQVKQLELRNKAVEDNFNRMLGVGNLIEKKNDTLYKVATIAQNASSSHLDYLMKKADFNLRQSLNEEQSNVEARKLRILEKQAGIDSSIYSMKDVAGWADKTQAYSFGDEMLKQSGDLSTMMTQGTPDPVTGNEVSYKTIYDKMMNSVQSKYQEIGQYGGATMNGILRSAGFVNEPGTPFMFPNGLRVYSDGSTSLKPIPQTPAEQLNKQTEKPVSLNEVNKTDEKLSFANDILNSILGVKTAYASTGEENDVDIDGRRAIVTNDNRTIADRFLDMLSGKEDFFSNKTEVKFTDDTYTKEALKQATSTATQIAQNQKSVVPSIPQYSNQNLNSFLAAIAKQEGYFGNPGHTIESLKKAGMDRPIRNNNPGNLKFAGQPGAVNAKGFAKFSTPEQGWNALKNQFMVALTGQSDVGYHPNMTLTQFIEKYAPKADNNNTKLYINGIVKSTGLSPNTKLYQLREWIGLE